MRGTAEIGDEVAGRYLLRERIGAGGMGVVWRAHDRELDRTVAVKCARVNDERAAKRLKNEARNAARLHHPHIVAVFDHIDGGGRSWLVMEYVPSRSLAAIVAAEGPLSPQQAAAIGWQIADALATAHAKGVVHGDVTPENILVTGDGIAKLADFGISRALWSDDTRDSLSGGVPGKPRYLAPEVASGEPASRESDQFSLGAALFAAVEGRVPYGEAASPLAYIGRARDGHIEPPRQAGQLTGPLTALLRIDPGSRPAAAETRELMAEVAPPSEAVRRLHNEGAALDRRRGPLPLGPLGTWPRRRAWTAVAAVALVAVLAAVLLTAAPWDDGSPARAQPSTPGGAHSAPAPTAPTAATARSALGDARSADPCSVLATAPLARFGSTQLAADYGNFDRCDILVGPPHEDPVVDVAATLLGTDIEAGSHIPTRRTGNVTVAAEALDGDECDRTLQLDDGNHIQLMARLIGDSGPDLCAMADAATGHAVTVMRAGTVPRRPSAAVPASLATADACALLTPAALGALPGVQAAGAERDFGNWGCHWRSSDGDSGVDLVFDRNSPPLDTSDGTPVAFGAGRGFVVPEYDDRATCTLRLVNRDFTDITGQRVEELADLTVSGTGALGKLCDTAKHLGTTAAARLPGT
ncbi:serine/threonine-protein kinase [Streptomyces sp. IBSBF 2435]|uniref:serine/threonine-protein kinase n=1 Tax=Streptomyces sp. IBSBF 2435 TaxID=2903531 RepID=UPI002FDC77BE